MTTLQKNRGPAVTRTSNLDPLKFHSYITPYYINNATAQPDYVTPMLRILQVRDWLVCFTLCLVVMTAIAYSEPIVDLLTGGAGL